MTGMVQQWLRTDRQAKSPQFLLQTFSLTRLRNKHKASHTLSISMFLSLSVSASLCLHVCVSFIFLLSTTSVSGVCLP